MAFVLPAVIFCVFAAIFSGAVGDRIRLHVGLADRSWHRGLACSDGVEVERVEARLAHPDLAHRHALARR
jgi:hypothetical protein